MTASLPSTFGDIVRTHAAERPDDTVFVVGDRHISWSTLLDRSCRAANAMIGAGGAPQEHVGFLDKNGPEFFEFQLGCGLANLISVSVNWRLAPPEIAYIVNDAQCRILVVGAELFPLIEAIEDRLTTVTTIVAIGDHPRWISWDDFLAAASLADPAVPSGAGDIAMQLYTSGTTGLPKGVMLTNANMFTAIHNVGESWALHRDAVNLISMPLFHIGGAGWALAGLAHGCRSVILREFVPDQALETIVREGVTTALLVPAMLQFLTMVPGAQDRTYPFERIVYGAAPITDETLRAAMRTFKCDFVQVYGMTETNGGITQLEPEDHVLEGPASIRLRSAGRAYHWGEIKTMSLEGDPRPCAPGEVGEVWARSGQNMLGYWNNPEATAATITPDGWLRTGDAGYLDADGYLFLTDRVKDMIVSGGENVYPAEVENAIAAHPAVAEVAVIGVPSDRWGETVKAIVVRRPGAEATAPEIIAFSKDRLAGYKCPTSVDFVDVLPRNPSGKVLKKDLREPYWAGNVRRIN